MTRGQRHEPRTSGELSLERVRSWYAEQSHVVLVAEAEISDFGFFERAEAERRLAPYDRARFKAALASRASSTTAYLSDGQLATN